MDPYKKVAELVDAIKNSDEVKNYMKIKDALYADEKSKEMIDEFRAKQAEAQNLIMQGKEADQEKMEKLQDLYQILVSNPQVKDFFDKEIEFDEMLQEIYKAIGDGVKGIIG